MNHEQLPLQGKNALVTGSSRDIGAGIVIELAKNGCSIIGNHRDEGKSKRANLVEQTIKEFGGDISFVVSDITESKGRINLYNEFEKKYGQRTNLDILILNASGPTREVNVVANNAIVDLFLPKMPPSSTIILMQSVPGHFYDQLENKDEIPDVYLPVAKVKNEGEQSLRSRIPEFEEHRINFFVVCPPVVPDTSNMKFFERKDSLMSEKHFLLSDKLNLPHEITIDQVSAKIVDLLQTNPPLGYIELFQDAKIDK